MNCNYALKVFESRRDIATELIRLFLEMAEEKKQAGRIFNVALSGGNTPLFFYKALGNEAEKLNIDFSSVRFFWVDERCVPPDSDESNYRQVENLLFSKIRVPDENIFRIKGEQNPETEAERYSGILYENLTQSGSFPVFDFLLLGVGRDGHTASIFPMSKQLYESEKAVVVSEHPDTGKKRVTITLPVIRRARRIIFLVTGADKRDILKILCNNKNEDPLFPASFVKSDNGSIEWFVDSDAFSSWPQDSD